MEKNTLGTMVKYGNAEVEYKGFEVFIERSSYGNEWVKVSVVQGSKDIASQTFHIDNTLERALRTLFEEVGYERV